MQCGAIYLPLARNGCQFCCVCVHACVRACVNFTTQGGRFRQECLSATSGEGKEREKKKGREGGASERGDGGERE